MTRTREIIAGGLADLGLQESEALLNALDGFIDILSRWNRTWNLTAIDEPAEMAVNHVLDSLSVASWLAELEAGSLVIDIGSGGGLPGVPLAMYHPHLRFLLLDSSGKKARFLTQAKIELGLGNVDVVNERAESCREQGDRVICRAFGSLAEISVSSAHLLKPGGRVLAMKGKLTDEELAEDLAGGLKITTVEALEVPFLDADRHIVSLELEGVSGTGMLQ